MSGKGPSNNQSYSQNTKPLAAQLEAETSQKNNSDSQFKKTTQVVGQPQTTDHNIADDFVKNPPENYKGQTDDFTLGGSPREDIEVADTVEAKSVEEIQSRIDN